jgi:hypothetical protein
MGVPEREERIPNVTLVFQGVFGRGSNLTLYVMKLRLNGYRVGK